MRCRTLDGTWRSCSPRIPARIHDDAEGIKQAYADKGWVFFTTWDDLIERAKRSHHQFREILQQRASESSTPGD